MTIYNWIIVAAWAAFLIYWFILSPRPKKSVGGNRQWWIRLAIVLVVIAFAYAGASRAPAAPALTLAVSAHPLLGAIGAACAVAGIAFAIWARYHLGANWGMPMTEREEPELITSGPYAYVRHPIYTGVLLALLGSTLSAGGWWIVIFFGYAAYFIYAAKKEEKVMLAKFPNQYPAYMARSKMLVPFIF